MKVFNSNLSSNNIQMSFSAKIHILDGGAHANNMEHFAKSVLKKVNKVDDLQMHTLECSSKAPALKTMDSAEDKLRELSASGEIKAGDYVSILGLTNIPVLNLMDRIKGILNIKTTVNFRNVKAQRALLMRFLSEIYNNPQKHSRQIEYMDGEQQNIIHTFGVIKLLNELSQKGIKVFLPAGHGADNTIKWLAKNNGVNDELYRFIATGVDDEKVVSKLYREADNKNYYDFNLLSLCNANIVNVNGIDGKNYIFSSRDGFANAEARGVYNFSPIRNSDGKVIGYGFHDEYNVDFPHESFDEKDKANELNKFVGLQYRDVMSGYIYDKKFKERVRQGISTKDLPDRLYPITDVFDESEIKRRKLDILGRLINREQDKIFDINPNGQIIFNKTNCEGSERPSVYSMWGSCFATVNAIKNDISKDDSTNTLISNFLGGFIPTAILINAIKIAGLMFFRPTKNTK